MATVSPKAPRRVPRERLPAWREIAERCAPLSASKRAKFRALALLAVHALILIHLAHWKVAGRTLTPLEPSEAMQTFEMGYVNAGFLLLVGSVLATALVGRFFCGWGCHVVAYQDLCAWLLGKVRLKPAPIRSRVLAWIPLFVALYMFAWPSLARWIEGRDMPAWRAHFTTTDFWATFTGPWVAALTLFVDGALVVWLFGAKGFCSYGCPYGALFALAERRAPWRIRVTDACEGCGHCSRTCTSNVDVRSEVARFGQVVDPSCMRCMDCVSVCPKKALYLGRGESRGAALARAAQPPARRFDFHWSEEAALALAFLGALYAWRGLYQIVPFLLAIGLALLSALSLVFLVRALGLRDFTFQRLVVRRAGQIGFKGLASIVVAASFLGLTGHGALVQFHAKEGERNLLAAGGLPQGTQRQDRIDASLEHLERARELGWLPVAKLEHQLGSIYADQGRLELALERLERAIAIDPSMLNPRLVLADTFKRLGRDQEAILALEKLLELDPTNAKALRRLGRPAPPPSAP